MIETRWTVAIAMLLALLPGLTLAQVPDGYPAAYK